MRAGSPQITESVSHPVMGYAFLMEKLAKPKRLFIRLFNMNQKNQTDRSCLLTIRPQIPTLTEAATSTAERFQNKTLRPILKLQNDLFVAVLQHYFQKRKNVFLTLSRTKKLEYIEHSIRKDLKFKNRLLGIVIGQMTQGEYADFIADESELTRRMTTMLIERMRDQLINIP